MSRLSQVFDGHCSGIEFADVRNYLQLSAKNAQTQVSSGEPVVVAALEIKPCSSVHTVGMGYAIDVVF